MASSFDGDELEAIGSVASCVARNDTGCAAGVVALGGPRMPLILNVEAKVLGEELGSPARHACIHAARVDQQPAVSG